MTKHDGGKGDNPIQPADFEQFSENWDKIFNQNKPTIELEIDNDHAEILATIPFGK